MLNQFKGDTMDHPVCELLIRRAGIFDSEAVLAILDAAAAGLRSRGMDQWPEDRFTEEGIVRFILHDEVYFAYLAGGTCDPVGTLRIQWSDPQVWGPDSDTAGAIYIHGLAIRPEFGGQGIGRQILAWAESYALAQGKTRLRLDCWAGNDRLRRYYEEAGFRFVDEMEEKTWRVARFEKTLLRMISS